MVAVAQELQRVVYELGGQRVDSPAPPVCISKFP